jgi:ABC-type uncharacterized transport system permease subunit
MPDSLLHISTGACWLGLTVLALRAASTNAESASATPAFRIEGALLPVALVLHGMMVYNGVLTDEGLNLGLANSVSLVVWLTVAIYWLASLVYPGLGSIQGLWAPIALVAVILQLVLPSRHLVQYGGDPLFTLHFAIAMLAYSLFIVATMHAVVMLAEMKWLRRGVMPPFLSSLPPLLEMEALLFRILFAAFVLLTLTVVSGVFFSEQLFGRPLQFTHKTVFGILSWLIFGSLLVGRYFYGWRGKRAAYWTLGGSLALMLAYIGAKFVLEVILKRG